MPRLPKWLADTMETLSKSYYHTVEVTYTEYYTPELKLIRLEGDLKNTKFSASNVVEFRVNDTDYRHYTPSYYNAEKGICEIIFYLHDKGSGSKWADDLSAGDKIKLIGPGGKMSYQPDFKHHFVFGDETSLGLMVCMSKAVWKDKNHSFFGLAELDKEHLDWINYLDADNIHGVETSFENPAKASIDLLKRWEKYFEENTDETFFYLTGRAKSIQSFRNFLAANGISNKQIKTYPYWAEGKKGL